MREIWFAARGIRTPRPAPRRTASRQPEHAWLGLDKEHAKVRCISNGRRSRSPKAVPVPGGLGRSDVRGWHIDAVPVRRARVWVQAVSWMQLLQSREERTRNIDVEGAVHKVARGRVLHCSGEPESVRARQLKEAGAP